MRALNSIPWLKRLYPQRMWKVNTQQPVIYLTFDDGPTPGVTEEVLHLLEQYNAKATFFFLGNRATQFPELVAQTKQAGHTIGHHSENHVNGWRTSTVRYIADVHEGAKHIGGRLFRPPYGKLTSRQARALMPHYTIVMWDIITGDYDTSISPETCAAEVFQHHKPGSIVVFHDSEKAKKNVLPALKLVLEELHKQGYSFEALAE
jgi:peptidoglycan/xylan/chitin deacetylase (PgdA/CDA1 family)